MANGCELMLCGYYDEIEKKCTYPEDYCRYNQPDNTDESEVNDDDL